MKKTVLSLLCVLPILFLSPAYALDLSSAKSSGLVGETQNGYIGAVKPSAEVNQLVSSVNSKRRTHYQKISKSNGQPLSVVESLAGKKLIDRLSAGQYYQNSGGSWVKK